MTVEAGSRCAMRQTPLFAAPCIIVFVICSIQFRAI